MRKIQNVGEVPFVGGRMKDNDEVDTKKNNKKNAVSPESNLYRQMGKLYNKS